MEENIGEVLFGIITGLTYGTYINANAIEVVVSWETLMVEKPEKVLYLIRDFEVPNPGKVFCNKVSMVFMFLVNKVVGTLGGEHAIGGKIPNQVISFVTTFSGVGINDNSCKVHSDRE